MSELYRRILKFWIDIYLLSLPVGIILTLEKHTTVNDIATIWVCLFTVVFVVDKQYRKELVREAVKKAMDRKNGNRRKV